MLEVSSHPIVPPRPVLPERLAIRQKIECPQPLKHKRYPLVNSNDRVLTLAIGVSCDDGVVLGVDGQLSVDNSKLPTQKINWFFPASN